MINRFDEKGYVNVPELYSLNIAFMFFLAQRQVGKTYGVLKHLMGLSKPFIYLRRTTAELEVAQNPKYNPFNALNRDLHKQIVPFKDKDIVTWCNSHIEDDKVIQDDEVCLGLSLSSCGKIRGMSLDGYDTILFDEICLQPMSPRRKGELEAFYSLYETISANREIQGKPPLRVIFLGNSDKLDSPMLRFADVDMIIESLLRKKQFVYTNGNIGVFLFDDSPIAKERKDTNALYNVLPDDNEYKQMATQNIWVDYEDTKKEIATNVPLKEYKCIYFVNGVAIWLHKSNGDVYVCRHKAGNPSIYNGKNDIKRFRHNHPEVYEWWIKGDRMKFDSYNTKTRFDDIFRL